MKNKKTGLLKFPAKNKTLYRTRFILNFRLLKNFDLEMQLALIPLGYSTRLYLGKKYGVTRSIFNNGKSEKVYAEELGGTDFISFNYYRTNDRELLKPCEMDEEKVIDFLQSSA